MDLLEREAGLQELAAAWQDAVAGKGQVVLVSGEAGIGKTSLVEHFTRERRDSAQILWGICDDLFTPRPLGPLHDMAVQLEGELPVLLSSDTNRITLFPAVLAELQKRPTVAVFEDVHWADEATLDLFKFLGRRILRTSALLILTYRDDELGPRHLLRSVLGDVVTSPAVRRIAVSPLSEKAVQELVGKRAIDPAALHRQTGGNPFFVTEALSSTEGGLPATIRDAVLARVARLSPSAQAGLQAAAVIGPRIEPWLLELVAGADAATIGDALAVGMLVAQGGLLAFRHELARQTVLETISPPHKLALHRFTLDGLRDSAATRHDLSRLAHHAEAAGERELVTEYAPAAARQASTAGAHREAVTLYALALRYSESLTPVEQVVLLEAYARECNVTEQQSEAIAAWKKALEIARQLQDPIRQGRVLAALTIMLRNNGNYSEAEAASQAAIELLESQPPGCELAMAYRAQATLRLSHRDVSEAIQWGEKAVALAKECADENVSVMAHIILGSAWLFQDYERGCAYLDHQLALVKATGEERQLANLINYAGSCAGELYQFQRAEHYLSEGIAYATEHSLDLFTRLMQAWQARVWFYQGRWSESVEILSQLSRQAAASTLTRIAALTTLGHLQARRGDVESELALNEALELAAPTLNLQHLGPIRAARAEAAWLAGDRKRALAEADAMCELAVSKQHPWLAGELIFWSRSAGADMEIFEWLAKPYALHIRGNWRAAADEWERLGCPYEQARALADGDTEAQINALEIFDQLGARPASDNLRKKMRSAGVRNIPRGPRSTTRENPFGLTTRQTEILSLLSEGLSNAEIAARLHLSPKTVDHHVSAVLTRLEVHSREEAAELGRRHPHFKKPG